jgi:hypothetical protein
MTINEALLNRTFNDLKAFKLAANVEEVWTYINTEPDRSKPSPFAGTSKARVRAALQALVDEGSVERISSRLYKVKSKTRLR